MECDWQPHHDGPHPSNYKSKEILKWLLVRYFVPTMRSITNAVTDTGISKGFTHLISRSMYAQIKDNVNCWTVAECSHTRCSRDKQCSNPSVSESNLDNGDNEGSRILELQRKNAL